MKKSEFDRIVQKSFVTLESKYKFKKTDTAFHTGGVIVTFQNPTTEVCLNYEISALPWITIADINNPEEERVSLDWLLVELGERDDPTTDEAFFPPKMEEEELEAEIHKKSEQLLRFGTDLLKGDFTLMPKLKERSETYLAECKKIADRYKAK
ncbi:MAG: hypothetical protein HN855_14640 [Anaerolineae bacterium]|nr:hypothetical protein [Anaerolineae bacterium]MBT7070887.1 hypothetical protein [Anaerolineae bacterium]MBT7326393.1 hypothetical protein [Anaerolineae bacterium]